MKQPNPENLIRMTTDTAMKLTLMFVKNRELSKNKRDVSEEEIAKAYDTFYKQVIQSLSFDPMKMRFN